MTSGLFLPAAAPAVKSASGRLLASMALRITWRNGRSMKMEGTQRAGSNTSIHSQGTSSLLCFSLLSLGAAVVPLSDSDETEVAVEASEEAEAAGPAFTSPEPCAKSTMKGVNEGRTAWPPVASTWNSFSAESEDLTRKARPKDGSSL